MPTPDTNDRTSRPGAGRDAGAWRADINSSRRDFLKMTGGGALAAAILTACGDDSIVGPGPDTATLGTGNVAVLNYAYALEQLEAAFYEQAVANPFAGATADELELLTDLRDHEVAHRDFFAAALGSAALADLQVDFSSIDFGSRDSVLATAQTFEDLGVSAYNGAGRLFTNDTEGQALLTVAGKIVSVEARHAAAIRSTLRSDRRAFAGDDVVDANGLDVLRRPQEVLQAASAFVVTEIDASGLPTVS